MFVFCSDILEGLILLHQPQKSRIELGLADAQALAIASPSAVEAHAAAWRRIGLGLVTKVHDLLNAAGIVFQDWTERMLHWVQIGFERYGKGRVIEPAALDFGDCFSYALAKTFDAPLLFKGDDFQHTDVRVAQLG